MTRDHQGPNVDLHNCTPQANEGQLEASPVVTQRLHRQTDRGPHPVHSTDSTIPPFVMFFSILPVDGALDGPGYCQGKENILNLRVTFAESNRSFPVEGNHVKSVNLEIPRGDTKIDLLVRSPVMPRLLSLITSF